MPAAAPDVQTLLLVAAADDSGQVATVRARRRGPRRRTRTPSTPRNASGLLLVDGDSVQVRHPLVRSAVYQAATSMERREAHRALATRSTQPPTRTGTPGTAPPPSTARMRASSPPWTRPARARNDAAGTPPPLPPTSAPPSSPPVSSPAPRRLFAAARNAWASGQSAQARTLSAAAASIAEDRLLRADIDRLRGRIEVNVGSGVDAHRIFATAARAVIADDPNRALELAVAAALMSTYGADSGTTLDVGRPRRDAPQPPATPRTRCLGHLLLSLTRASAHEWAPALASLRAALEAGADVADLDLLSHLGNAALHLGDDEAHHRSFTAMLTGARDAGAGMLVLYALPRLGFTQLVTGKWTELRSSAEEALSLSTSTGQRPLGAAPLGWLTLLAALQGRPRLRRAPRRPRHRGRAAARGARRPRARPDLLGEGHPRRTRR